MKKDSKNRIALFCLIVLFAGLFLIATSIAFYNRDASAESQSAKTNYVWQVKSFVKEIRTPVTKTGGGLQDLEDFDKMVNDWLREHASEIEVLAIYNSSAGPLRERTMIVYRVKAE